MFDLALALITGLVAPQGAASVAPAAVRTAPAPLVSPRETPVTQGPAAGEATLSRPLGSAATAFRGRSEVEHELTQRSGGKRTHRFRFSDGTRVEFTDRPRRGGEGAERESVVASGGVETAGREPASTFDDAGRAAGLSPEAIAALRYVSRHEGGFDAINTWDHARFSWGFIQFAGGRGLPRLLAHMKLRDPERFAALLGQYGVDVLPGADGKPEPVYVDPQSGEVLRGDAAEQAYGSDPFVIALFIRAARAPEIKRLQVEAAIQDYAAPALRTPYRGLALGRILSSPKSMAMLMDRQVHEGNVRRFTRALDQVVSEPEAAAAGPELEARVLDRVVSEAEAGAGRMIADRLRKIRNSELPGP